MASSSCTSSSSVYEENSHSETENDSEPIMGRGREEESQSQEELFENSATDDAEHSRNTASSSVTSKAEKEAAWGKLPLGAKDICSNTKRILYITRYESFIQNKWPYDVKKGNLCHPRALALAGLEFHSLEPAPSAKCIVCLRILENLKSNSNPWILHSETNPDCYIVQLGQQDKVDDYTMDQCVEMLFRKLYNEAENILKEKQNALKKQLFALKKHESATLSKK